jgi:polyisoprenoid-binding protein YceI
MKKILLCVTVIAVAGSAFTVLTEWKSDDKASVKWQISDKNGVFTGITTKIEFDKAKLKEAKISATVDAKTLDAGIEGLTGHLKSADFFDVEKYPMITFSSTEITATDAGYLAKGNLKMKDSTKVVELPFTFTEEGTNKAVFNGSLAVNCVDYGVMKSGKKGGTANITLNVPVSK